MGFTGFSSARKQRPISSAVFSKIVCSCFDLFCSAQVVFEQAFEGLRRRVIEKLFEQRFIFRVQDRDCSRSGLPRSVRLASGRQW